MDYDIVNGVFHLDIVELFVFLYKSVVMNFK